MNINIYAIEMYYMHLPIGIHLLIICKYLVPSSTLYHLNFLISKQGSNVCQQKNFLSNCQIPKY